ncbi:MAG: DNA replication/repair protein RecF [Deltaproteobacteria bacterium]|nr:DNA replication/repair protein RecF [Deltaproteobacteria bacterium]MCB9785612.1 DNA replication/repair protein RecF [Deltaproteobacteria bacterium]
MQLLALEAERLRNLAPLRLEPHPRFNVFEGDNGQGKTNVLEAIYLLATLRSFREARARNLVCWGESDAWVRGEIERRGIRRKMGVELAKTGKRAAIDGRVVDRLSEYFGHLHVVVFGPEDLVLTKGAPVNRRRFLDRAIFNLHPSYLDEMRAFVTALKHRNELLRASAGRGVDRALLASFDEELIRRGGRVLWRRTRFVSDFLPVVRAVFDDVTAGAHAIGVDYESLAGLAADADEDACTELYRQRLSEATPSDLRQRRTTQGPHTDDLAFSLDGFPARVHASQGQHRAMALALKIAELQLADSVLGGPPLLLLDDVSSELDRGRNAQLMAHLSRAAGQIFVTTTDRRWIAVDGETQVFRVEAGRVLPEP